MLSARLSLVLFLMVSTCAGEEDRCSMCTKIVDKFQMGLVRTAKSNFGGGNSHWEEQKLGRYEFSETRFLEVMEAVCTGGESQCHSMLEELEETFERWWRKYYALEVESDLRDFMCVRKLKVCCAKGTYGTGCVECKGGKRSPCGGHGVCQGEGTKSGTGECVCEEGYEGSACGECSTGFHPVSATTSPDRREISCEACHPSCMGGCDGQGPMACRACKEAWVWVPGVGCSDVNECEDETMCKVNELCENSEGSYKCIPCNKACFSCTGFSHQDCIHCSSNFYASASNACLPCHESCMGGCDDGTASTCKGCKRGWRKEGDKGCIDADECGRAGACVDDEYCINTVGSFKCSTCHPSCDGCHDSGSDKCKRCKRGYELSGDSCVDTNECLMGACSAANKRCTNVPGSFVCECVAGFTANEDDVCVPSPPVASANRAPTTASTKKASKMPANKDNVVFKQKNTPPPPSPLPKMKKKMKQKSIENFQLLQYLLSLLIFALGTWLSASFVSLQAILTAGFSVYLYYHATNLDELLKNSI